VDVKKKIEGIGTRATKAGRKREWASDLVSRDKRGALLVVEGDPAAPGEHGHDGLEDGEEGEDGEGEGGPVDERGVPLVREDGKEGPGDGGGASEIALGGREGVGGGCGFEEEESEEDKDLGPDAGLVVDSIDAKGLEGGEDDEDGGPAVVEREGEMDPELVVDVLAAVGALDDVVDVGDGGGDEEGKDKGDDVVLAGPDVDVDGVEDGEEGEAPADAVDDGALAGGEELVDHGAAEEEVDEGPDAERPGGGRDVRLLAVVVDARRPRNRVHVRAEEEEIGEDVDDLEQDSICPRVGHLDYSVFWW